MTEPEDRYLLTEGVVSTVMEYEYGGRDDDERRAGIGHVALFDWDDHVDPDGVAEMVRDGPLGSAPTFVFESSDGSYHGWNVGVRSFSETDYLLAAGNDDVKHQKVGRNRGWWRLRYGEKRRVRDDVYKPAPELVRIFDPTPEGTPPRVSDPHLELARLAGVPTETVGEIRERYRPVGDTTQVVAYVTMTDMEKHIRRRAEDW